MAQTTTRHPSPWHALSVEEILQRQSSDPEQGLGLLEAKRRRDQYGPNQVARSAPVSWVRRFARELANPLTLVLALAVALTVYLGDYVDAVVIGAVIVLNATIGFAQEYRAEKALGEVANLLTAHATVVREGRRQIITADDVVPGDVVWLQAGDRVPADVRILDSDSLEADQSALTGESAPAAKQATPTAVDTVLAERTSMAYAGTLITRGTALGISVATGQATELGAIGSMMRSVQRLRTPLTRRLDRLALQISAAVLVIATLTLAWGFFVGARSVDFLLIAVVGLAVGAIPEGLPAVVSFALAWSARRLAKLGALVRRLPAVEALGSVDVVFTDKTGTLTSNEMTVVALETPHATASVSGVGFDAEGALTATAGAREELEALVTAMALCNDSEWNIASDTLEHSGDPTEIALLVLAHKAGFSIESLRSTRPRTGVVPFDADNQYMITAHGEAGDQLLLMKGAPERVLELCGGLDTEVVQQWKERVNEMAGSGHRVLAATRARGHLGDIHSWPDASWEFLGVVALIDPPRPDAIDALEQCRQAGVHVMMVTGDHPSTAVAIAGQLGMNGTRVLTGHEIDQLDDAALSLELDEVTVMARVSPAHKLRLVRLSQAAGHFVAMTGDGVNDAPALRQAHIGVAMGEKGTDVAREAADIVLTDDRFATIAQAIREGRRVYDNIKKSILFLLATDLDEAALIMLAIVFGIALPVTPTQILWVNLVTSVTLSFALIVERAESSVMRRGPNPQSLSLISKRMLARMLLVATLSVAATFWVFYEQLAVGVTLEEAQTAAVTMLVIVEVAILFSHRRFTHAALSREGLTGNRAALGVMGILLLVQLAFVYLPVMNDVFGSRPLPAQTWAVIVVTALGVFVAVELEKWWRRRRGQEWL